METPNFIFPCFWSKKPCSRHTRYEASHAWPSRTSRSATTAAAAAAIPQQRTSILDLPTELLLMIAAEISQTSTYSESNIRGAVTGGLFYMAQVFPLTDRVCFALAHPRILHALGGGALVPHQAVSERHGRDWYVAGGARIAFLRKLERDAWPELRYCERCDILHSVAHLRGRGLDLRKRIEFGGNFYQLPVEYVKLVVERHCNKGKGGLCVGLLECSGPQEEYHEIHNFRPPNYPTTNFAFAARAKEGRPVKEVTDAGHFIYAASPPSALKTLVTQGPRKAYSSLITKFSKRAETTLRRPVLHLPATYEGVREKISASFDIRLEIEASAVVLNGVFAFTQPCPPVASSTVESETIRSIDWRICPHVTMRYRVIDDSFEPATPACPGTTTTVYQRECRHCRTYFRIYGSRSWRVKQRYSENVAIRRELGAGRRPEDGFWKGDGLGRDLYDNSAFEKLLRNRKCS